MLSKAPAISPGKNPAAIAAPGKAGQLEFRSDDWLKLGIDTGVVDTVTVAGVEVEVNVGSGVAVDVGELVIGLIVVQSFPSGQQINVVESSTLKHVDDFGQQKLDGSFESGQLEKSGSPQVLASLTERSKPRPVKETEETVRKSDWRAQANVNLDCRISKAKSGVREDQKLVR
ncbi:predicted protein [Uncinocarpus reesii 1704]|uniref:Uncharacterized protein n=1 Tax=Uncinocarpus reesii (strain UAMH 1704) TaxID=336963 RepID=C4JF50_UNCRE|nr:uncharacterized protein UREG_02272 [Uncinocarpus reesii 1704]EEP77423.1 predicted protein [Uncinocarpus reesii 1704]